MGHHLVPLGMGLECNVAGESQLAWACITSVCHGKLSSFVVESMVSTSRLLEEMDAGFWFFFCSLCCLLWAVGIFKDSSLLESLSVLVASAISGA